jgi:hypothetical protein
LFTAYNNPPPFDWLGGEKGLPCPTQRGGFVYAVRNTNNVMDIVHLESSNV